MYLYKSSFVSGEFSENTACQPDLQRYDSAARVIYNAFVHPQGGVSNRPGTRFISDTKYPNTKSRLIPFQFSQDQTYILEFGDKYVRFYMDGGQIVDSNGLPYEIPSPYTEDTLKDITYAQSADVLFLCQKDTPIQTLNRFGHTNWEIKPLDFKGGAFLDVNTTNISLSFKGAYNIHREIFTSSGTFTVPDWALNITVTVVGGAGGGLGLGNIILGFAKGGDGGGEKHNLIVTPGDVYNVIVGIGGLANRDESTRDGQYSSFGDITAMGGTGAIIENGKMVDGISGYNSGLVPPYGIGRMGTNGTDGVVIVEYPEVGTQETLNASADLFNQQHVGALFKIEHFLPAQSIRGLPGDAGFEITAYDSWRWETTGYWSGSFEIQKFDKNSNEWVTIRTLQSSGQDNKQGPVEIIDPPEETKIRIKNINYSQEHSEGKFRGRVLLEASATQYWGIVKIIQVLNPRTAVVQVLVPIGSEEATKEWFEGAWSAYRGYPSAVTLHEQRLVLGSTKHQPQTIWLSKTGDYYNFSSNIVPKDDDSITKTLASQKISAIRHLLSLSNALIALTSSTAWRITPGYQEAALTPESFVARIDEYYGSSMTLPVIIGNRIIFIQHGGTVVRDFGYSLETEGFVSSELNIYARHLFEKHNIIDATYQTDPNNLGWFLREDGILLGCTYLREQNVWAWHRHETQGQIESICSIDSTNGEDKLYLIVKRGTKRFVEILEERMKTTDSMDQFFVDCGLSYEGEPKQTLIGLEHLEGYEVVILGNGIVLPKQIVRNSQITLPIPVTKCHIGLSYLTEIEPVKIDYQTRDGSSQARLKVITDIILRVENTRGIFKGQKRSNMEQVKQTMGDVLYTGDIKTNIPSSYNRDGTIIIQQRDPLPMTILGIICEVQHGG